MTTPIKATVTIEMERLSAAVDRWMRALRKQPGEAIRTQFRLLIRDILRFTPPTGEKGTSPKRQGENAVKRDIGRAVVPLYAEDFDSPRIKALILKKDADGLQEAFSRMPKFRLRTARIAPFTPALHRSQQDRRGRVGERKNPAYATLDTSAWEKYVDRIKGHVGMAKGGWAAAGLASGTAVPFYARRHAASGTAIDRSTSEDDPFIEATNSSPWARGNEDTRVVKNAMATREKAMELHLEKLLQDAAEKEGL